MPGYLRHGHPWVDDRQRPLYVFELQESAPTLDDVRAFEAAQQRFFGALEHEIAWITDVSRVLSIPPAQRRLYREGEASRAEVYRERIKALGIVCETALQRGLVTAVFWFARPPCPYRIFGTRAEAEAYCAERLA